MLPYRDSRFTVIALIVFFVIAIGYAFFEARGLLFGPTIDVPAGQTVVHDPYVVIQGSAQRISSLTMNGAQIQVTEAGAFSQPYLLASGYNRIVLDAKDQYGRTRERVIEIMYIPTSTPPATGSGTDSTTSTSSPQATTSPSASSTTPVAPNQ